MKVIDIAFLGAIVTFCTLLSSGCAATDGHHSNVRFLMPGMAVTPHAQSESEQDSYQPPRNPQFNTARDQ
jgi:hypothetical protein